MANRRIVLLNGRIRGAEGTWVELNLEDDNGHMKTVRIQRGPKPQTETQSKCKDTDSQRRKSKGAKGESATPAGLPGAGVGRDTQFKSKQVAGRVMYEGISERNLESGTT